MKRYEYRLISILFDGKGNMLHCPDAEVPSLLPGERIFETTGKPEYHARTGQWHLPVLTEREIPCSSLAGETDTEKLTALLKGELK